MGNRFSRKLDGPANSAETAATEQKTEEVPAAPEPAEEAGITQTLEAVGTESLDVVVGEPVTLMACLPTEECVSECKEVEAPAAPAPLNDAEPEPVAKETPAPVQLEPLVSVSEPSPPEPAAEPKPVAETQLAPEPAPEPVPEPAPEPVPEPEPTSNPEAEVEAVPEPILESLPAPAEALEPQTDLLTQESHPDPVLSSPPLIDMGVPDVTLQPNTPPSPVPIPAPVNADKLSDIPVTQECQDSAEVSVISTFEPEKSEETSESLEKLMEVEAAGNLEQLVSDVNEESLSGLLKGLELKGNDLVADLIPTDVKIPDDTPITDMSPSTELM
ncbi:uncharacterized protein [Enoplosus armatus]|uniref:uncharacterized protein n=1 Tax=Enoplosus armatus TaxID=215367 RepID=UPI003995BEFB